jgi:D-alanine--poly(phosphoribitol) ligase subunit 1
MDLLARIDRWGRETPDRVAHVCGAQRLTYGELLVRSDALAEHLLAMLPKDRSPFAVLGHKEPEQLIAFLACVKSGHPYVPIDSSLPLQRIEQIIATAQTKITLTPKFVAEHATDIRSSSGRTNPTLPTIRPDDPFYIMFTSGSTGAPKGVVITHGCLTTFLDWMLTEQSFAEQEETFLNQVPYSFDVSFMDTFTSLLTGGTVWSITRDEIANPKLLYQSLTVSGVTTWVSTPSFAQMCLVEKSFGPAMLPLVRRFLFCGETLAPRVASQLLDHFPDAQVWNTYGPTEATVATTSVLVDRELLSRYAPLPIGRPMPGSQIVIMDDQRREVAPGERGEIVIVGRHVSPGYLGRPDLTEKVFFLLNGERAYRTGDEGHYQDGLLFFDGRLDHQIKLHGYRIELGDIEANLQALSAVRDAVVLPIKKEGQVESLAAFVILQEAQNASDFEISQTLRTLLAERIPAYMIPRKFKFLEAFPMTANGKADRRKLAEMLA